MKVDYIILGQGICGTMLSWNLIKQGKKILVIDNADPSSSTRVASGIINPVTGRRVVTTWMAEELLPFVWNEYNAFALDLDTKLIEQKDTIVFPPSPQMLETYQKRSSETGSYVHPAVNPEEYTQWFDFVFDCYSINPTYIINLHSLMNDWRKKLLHTNSLLEETFDQSQLVIEENNIRYKNITAEKIIFCDGVNTFQHPLWKNLPYVYNKGQALVAEIPQLSAANIYKYGSVTIAPWNNGLWWIGSSYENEFDTTAPTESFRKNTEASLKNILKIPFIIKDHLASLRPATIERRPFVGLHPQHNNMAIFNGMGTKGCSLAPWFAKQFADYLVSNVSLDPLCDIKRFHRILTA